jgi:predicted TIM-barrel fold metal-dependent hydrolase
MLTRRGVLHQIGAGGVAAATLRSHEAASAERGAVTFEVPRGACDCHVHVFGDPKVFPFAAERAYTPPGASIDELLALHRALHMDRVVVVHPSPYGTDNSCSIDAVRRLGARARGIAVIDKSTTRTAIEEMAGIGFRGIRLNLETSSGGRFDPAAARAALDAAAEQIKGLNWHVQFYTRLPVIEALHDHLAQLPFPVVFDHFGRVGAALGPNQPGIDAMLDLLKRGQAYIKISGAYRISDKAPDFADATPIAQLLVRTNPDRIVWGSDWPHPNGDTGRGRPITDIAPPFSIDDGLVLNQLSKWVPDAATRKNILVDNPARLYGFEPIAL